MTATLSYSAVRQAASPTKFQVRSLFEVIETDLGSPTAEPRVVASGLSRSEAEAEVERFTALANAE